MVVMQFKAKKRPPFDFILEELADVITDIKPMFGAFGLYREHKILMILRQKGKNDKGDGMWVAVDDGHRDSIRADIPELRDLELFGEGPSHWQILSDELENFEEVAIQICEMIKKRDVRIGRTPKARMKKSKPKNKKSITKKTKTAAEVFVKRSSKKKASKKVRKKAKKTIKVNVANRTSFKKLSTKKLSAKRK